MVIVFDMVLEGGLIRRFMCYGHYKALLLLERERSSGHSYCHVDNLYCVK